MHVTASVLDVKNNKKPEYLYLRILCSVRIQKNRKIPQNVFKYNNRFNVFLFENCSIDGKHFFRFIETLF